MALQNDDLLLVNRGGDSFKTEYSEIKTDIIDSVPVVDPGVTEIVAGDNVTIDPVDGLGAVTINAADPGIEEAPNDGKQYARQNEAWSEVTGSGVTQIVAGDNVTIDPVDGLGTVTINSTDSGVTSIIAGDGISVDQATGDVTITNTGGGDYSGASAWGRGEGDGTLLSGFNISSVTRVAGGEYDVVFTTPMPDANYAVNVTTSSDNARTTLTRNQTAAGFTFALLQVAGSATDAEWSFAVFATNVSLPLTVTQAEIDTFKATATALQTALTRIAALEADHATAMNNMNGGY